MNERRRASQGFGLGQRDIGYPLAVHRQHGKFGERVEKLADPLRELVLVGQKRHQHADGQAVRHDGMGADDDDQDAIDPEQPRAQRGEDQIDPGDPHVGAHPVAQVVRPKALPSPFDPERS